MSSTGNLNLHPSTTSELTSSAYKIYFQNFFRFFFPSLLIYFITFLAFGLYLIDKVKEFLLTCSFSFSTKASEQAFGIVSQNILPILKIYSLFLVFVFLVFVEKIFISSFYVRFIENKGIGREETLWENLKFTFQHPFIYAVIAAVIVQGVIQLGAMIGLIALLLGAFIIGIWLTISLLFVLPVVVIERRGPIKALKRSFNLVSNYFWNTLLNGIVMTLALGIPIVIIQTLISIPLFLDALNLNGLMELINMDSPTTQQVLDFCMDIFKRIEHRYWLYALIMSTAYTLATPLEPIVSTLLYYNVKSRKILSETLNTNVSQTEN
ncbi:MAG: hypothetical protein A3H98_07410 [Bacteroidetes bacterium RIFCSPLOWO2_02_FULL_36_8]|nr:MAG: hypothetical protein A3H98_07410 [Bacteroidetes bacterium RIFCSPLOWO2_02_FULL_36_8]OFY69899.1 MAG: hypothetical protein A3G23_05405 [Bacteroidetes bacterium RIFCSPLOWO2_12_FULL_37_12]